MRLIYHGPLYPGSTSLQRLEAFGSVPGVEAIGSDSGDRFDVSWSLYRRVRWKLRWPVDANGEGDKLVALARSTRPDAVVVNSSRILTGAVLARLRAAGVRCLAYYTPDDIIGAHNLSWPLRLTFPLWDVFFTTKTFNVPELAARGVRQPYLIGKAYDPALHRPMSPQEVGTDFERFDLVFVGAYEAERGNSINRLAEAGLSVVVYGGNLSGWSPAKVHPAIELRPHQFGENYVKSLHHGRIALCYLRKLNRDRITQRTMEITACARPMLGEKTDEHDQHFLDGAEYLGFASDDELVAKASVLAKDAGLRAKLGQAARARCLASAYSSFERAREMIGVMEQASRPA